MDSNTLTIIGTFIVAIISGLLAYSSSLSTKEKEIKLALFEKLGLDAHSTIEKLHNNTEWLILILKNTKHPTRKQIFEANNKSPVDVDKVRELRVRILFFDKKCSQKYESIISKHGELTPRLFGFSNKSLAQTVPLETPYTQKEIDDFIAELTPLASEIHNVKEYILKKASSKYNKAISSSKKITALAFVILIIAFAAFIFYPINGQTKAQDKEKVTLLESQKTRFVAGYTTLDIQSPSLGES